MENPVRINIVETCIREGKMPSVRLVNDCEIANPSARQLYMVCR